MKIRSRSFVIAVILTITILAPSSVSLVSADVSQVILKTNYGTSTYSDTIPDQNLNGQTSNIQVGARLGDEAARANIGLKAEIKTRVYSISYVDAANAFWIGDSLQNGAFIQFGYVLYAPGTYCLSGRQTNGTVNCSGPSYFNGTFRYDFDTIGNTDARWFWEYWPNWNATVLGPNDIMAGTGEISRLDNDFLWAQQYTLTIQSQFPASGNGTYDVSSIANFSTVSPQITTTNLRFHEWVFDGWYDENGNLITTSPTGSIVMDESHTLTAKWHETFQLPFTLAVAAILIIFASVVLMFRARKRRKKKSKDGFIVRTGELSWTQD